MQVIPLKLDGYLPVTIQLDTKRHKLKYGGDRGGGKGGGDNVLGVWTDDSTSTGWWYEGSGLVRHAALVAVPVTAWLPAFAVASPATVTTSSIRASTDPEQRALGGRAGNAVVSATVAVASAAAGADVMVTWSLVAADGTTIVAAVSTKTTTVAGYAGKVVAAPPMHLPAAELWGVKRPYLYTLITTVSTAAAQLDSVNTTVGIRDIEWNPQVGLKLNAERVKQRGFCNHESFAAVGAAIPPRVDLLRLQQLRGIGGNAWRTSHNPPEPVLLDLTDRLGVIVLDENRVFATTSNCNGDECPVGAIPLYAGNVPADNGHLALRDRNHASVLWWSLCNENGCGYVLLFVHIIPARFPFVSSLFFCIEKAWQSSC